MKNIILGMIGVLMVIWLSLITISIYNRQIRKNELERNLSGIVKTTLQNNYTPYREISGKSNASEEEVAKQLEFDIRNAITTKSDVEIQVKACDLQKGLLSVCVIEKFHYPFGKEDSISLQKTAIVDRKENHE